MEFKIKNTHTQAKSKSKDICVVLNQSNEFRPHAMFKHMIIYMWHATEFLSSTLNVLCVFFIKIQKLRDETKHKQ